MHYTPSATSPMRQLKLICDILEDQPLTSYPSSSPPNDFGWWVTDILACAGSSYTDRRLAEATTATPYSWRETIAVMCALCTLDLAVRAPKPPTNAVSWLEAVRRRARR